jgi:hypothetical protein
MKLTAIGVKHGRKNWEIKTHPTFYCHTENGRAICSPVKCKDFETLENARVVPASNKTVAESIYKTDLKIDEWRRKR